jgi:hypothetical protein
LDLVSDKIDDWDTAVAKLNELESKIFHFYPTCTFYNREFDIINSFSSKIQISRKWELGKKTIITGIYNKEVDVDNIGGKEFITICMIENRSFLDSAHMKKEKERESKIKNSPGRF